MNLNSVSSIVIPEGKAFSCFDSEDNLLYNGFRPEDYELDDSDITFSVGVPSTNANHGKAFVLNITLPKGINASDGYIPVVFDRTINGVVKLSRMIYGNSNNPHKIRYGFYAIKPMSEHVVVVYMINPNGKLLKYTVEKTLTVL